VCRDCQWKKTVAPRSDALGAGEYFTQCPRCTSMAIKVFAAGFLDGLLAELMARRRRF
jgi:hypothetical protein